MYKKYIRIIRFELKNRKNLELKEARCKKKACRFFFYAIFRKNRFELLHSFKFFCGFNLLRGFKNHRFS